MGYEEAKEKLSPLSEFSLYILLSLYDDERHGYGVVLKTRKLTDGKLELKTATVYSAINRFIEYGLVKYTRNLDGKKYYQITSEGIELLKHEIKRLKKLSTNIKDIMKE